jgi:hypothetical protein
MIHRKFRLVSTPTYLYPAFKISTVVDTKLGIMETAIVTKRGTQVIENYAQWQDAVTGHYRVCASYNCNIHSER